MKIDPYKFGGAGPAIAVAFGLYSTNFATVAAAYAGLNKDASYIENQCGVNTKVSFPIQIAYVNAGQSFGETIYVDTTNSTTFWADILNWLYSLNVYGITFDVGSNKWGVDQPSTYIVFNTVLVDYYVTANGNDATGDGSISAPWATLYQATSVVTTPGSMINVGAGTFLETQQSILAAGVSIKGAGVSSIIQSGINTDYFELIRLYQVSEGVNGNQSISHLKFDGDLANSSVLRRGIWVRGRKNVSIHDITMVNFKERGILFDGRTDNTEGPPTTYATGNSFYRNVILNSGGYILGAYGAGCFNLGGQDGMLVYQNRIVQDQRVRGENGWPIKYSSGGYIKGCKIFNNTLIKNVFEGDYNGDMDWDFAVELWNSQGGNEIFNNFIQGATDLAYNDISGSYTWSYWFHDNIVQQPALNTKFNAGIYTERQVYGIIIENNVFDKVAGAISMNIEDFPPQPPTNTLRNVLIQLNLMTNLGRAVGDGNNGFGIQVSTHPTAIIDFDVLHIYNNTIVASNGNAPFEGISINLGSTPGALSNVSIINNIVQGFWDNYLYVANSVATITTFLLKNNCRYLNANSNNPTFVNGTPAGYVNSGNIIGNPLFVSSTDYHLQSGSPCRAAGINVGTPFIGLFPDIGYVQYNYDYPSVNVSAKRVITLPTSITTLIALGEGNGPLTYAWTKTGGPAGGSITSPTAATTGITGLIQGNYIFQCTITDINFFTSINQVVVQVIT